MIQFYVSHCCKYNLHVTTFEKNDLIYVLHVRKHDGITKCA